MFQVSDLIRLSGRLHTTVNTLVRRQADNPFKSGDLKYRLIKTVHYLLNFNKSTIQ